MKRAIWIVVPLVVVLVGCGEESSTTTVVKEPRPAKTTTVVQEAPQAQAVPEPQPASSLTVPDLVGERLDVAEDDLKDMGLRFEEIGGGTFGVVDVTAWEVCETDPSAGTEVPEGEQVELVVDRPGEC